MQIKRGTTRVVLIAFGFAIKFPTLKQRTLHGKLYHYMRGVIANLTEFTTYIRFRKENFLAPVISVGCISIQRFQAGEKPTWEEVDAVLNRLSPKARATYLMMDKNHFSRSNFHKKKVGLCMIDFGDKFGDICPLSAFLRLHHEEFASLLSSLPQR